MGKLKNSQTGFSAIEALLIVVIVAIVGGTGFYVYHAQTNANKNLKGDNSTAPKFKNNSKKAAKTPATAQTTDETIGTVKISFSPANLYSSIEKSTLKAKLLEPIIDFDVQFKDTNGYVPLASLSITKKTDAQYAAADASGKYRYSVHQVSTSGGTTDFLYGQNDTIDWWLPQCYANKCDLTDTFKAKYPEIVKQLQASGLTP